MQFVTLVWPWVWFPVRTEQKCCSVTPISVNSRSRGQWATSSIRTYFEWMLCSFNSQNKLAELEGPAKGWASTAAVRWIPRISSASCYCQKKSLALEMHKQPWFLLFHVPVLLCPVLGKYSRFKGSFTLQFPVLRINVCYFAPWSCHFIQNYSSSRGSTASKVFTKCLVITEYSKGK